MTLINPRLLAQCIILVISFFVIAKVLRLLWRLLNSWLIRRRGERCKALLKQLYADIDAFEISRQYRKQENISADNFTYGEIIFSSFAEMLAIVQPKKNEIFYDLGCGAGKAVFTAALLYPDIIVRGVELLPPLYALCLNLKSALHKRMLLTQHFKHSKLNVEFILGNFLAVDFSEVNIVYLNVVCFDNAFWDSIGEKLGQLPVNARVIIISKHLTSAKFNLICQQSFLMSWGMNTISIYRKIA